METTRSKKSKEHANTVTISLLNMKGGVGKTTLAVNLAWYICRKRSKRVLLIDLDPQFNTSQYTMSYDEWADHKSKKGTVADIILEPQKARMKVKKKTKHSGDAQLIQKCIFVREESLDGGRLDILPSELDLSAAVKNPHTVAFKLEKSLENVRKNYDYVFIDCAPTDSVLTETALMASDFILTTVKPDRFSVLGYAQIQEVLETFRNSFHDPHHVQNLGVVFTQVQGDSSIESECMNEIELQAEYVFASEIRKSNSYLQSVHQQSPIFDTRYTRKLTMSDLSGLVREMEIRINDLTEGSD